MKRILSNERYVKIFHFARFDLRILFTYLQITIKNLYCTKIASIIARTYTDYHGLKDLCFDLLNIKITKDQQCSDWGGKSLTPEQQIYAATDVKHLHSLRKALNNILKRENRLYLIFPCFHFISCHIELC